MIFSLKQEQKINNIVQNLIDNTNKNVQWVLREEDYKYSNTIHENLIICLGHGKLDHFENNNTGNETFYYYSTKKQLDYFINIFRCNENDLRVVVYECKYGQIDGCHKINAEIIKF